MIPYGKQFVDEEDINKVISTLQGDYLTTGPKVKEFEDSLCKYTGGKYCLSCGNGTQALHLAYLAIGIQKGDEVITTANTFVATSNMVIACGAVPVFCDIKMDGYNIDEEKIEGLITQKTKAIAVVHFAGRPCNMNKIWEVAEKYNLKVIEDAAHALGAEYDGIKIGNTKSDITTFSFHPVKPITTGEGGAVITNNRQYFDIMEKMRSHGISRDKNGFNDMVNFGFNYRITDIQCALGLSQIKKLDTFINYRKRIVSLYGKYFKGIQNIQLPKGDDISNSGWHLYVIRFDNLEVRNSVMNLLKDEGYGVTLHYPPVHKNTYYRNNGYNDLVLKNAEEYYNTCLSLPIFYGLKEEDIKRISSIINKHI